MKNSFVELRARERGLKLLDNEKGTEVVGPFDELISPHLEPQGIVPESDDGVVLLQGTISGKKAVVIAIEGAFQGGGIGEVSGAKIAAALEMVLQANESGDKVYPVIILDTGGVRLQEANYGLLSISEIGNMIVALKKYVPVIGLVPGLVGSFGGMSITSALMSYLIATKKARIGLNGPEVIEQEAGVMEFDSSDKALIWDTIGSNQRVKTGVVDEVVVDDVETIRQAVTQAIEEEKDSKRTEQADFFLSMLENLDPSQPLTPAEYTKLYNSSIGKEKEIVVEEATSGKEIANPSRGHKWFTAFTGIANPTSNFPTVLHKTMGEGDGKRTFISLVPNAENSFYRVRNGELGLQEGFATSKVIAKVMEEDKDKKVKRPIIQIIDVPSQAYGYNEELIGIHVSLASSAEFYARARQAGHPVIGLIIGNAISGAFLAHGLQSNRLIAIDDEEINVQAMSKESAARITNRTIEELEAATEKVPAMAYDIRNFQKLGALYDLLPITDGKLVTETDVKMVQEKIDEAIGSTVDASRHMSFRYETEAAKTTGRVATREVRKRVKEQWVK